MPSLPATLDEFRRRLPPRRIPVAIVAYYAVVTCQLARFQPRLEEFPPVFGTMIGIDPDATLPVQYPGYVAGASVGDWGGGISILAGRPVTALLAHSLPWLALVVVIAIVAAVAGVALRARFRPGRVPNWMVGYAVSSVAFLAGLSLLVGWRDAPGDFFLTTATSASDYPLVLGARRLLVLGYPVGAVALSGGALVAVDERSTAARARAETVA